MIDYSNYLRLEIEVPTTGLKNSIENPSGVKGAWAWVTPVANSTMEADQAVPNLVFKNNATQAVYFKSSNMRINPGQYVGGRFDLVGTNTSTTNVKVRFEFYDVNKVLLSSSAQTAAFSTAGTYYIPVVSAPSSTVYFSMRFDVYTSTGNSASGSTVTFKNVMASVQNRRTDYGDARVNLMYNSSFEYGLDGYNYYGSTNQAAIVTSPTSVGGKALALTKGSAGGSGPEQMVPVIPGETYTFSGRVRAATTGRDTYVYVWFSDSNFNFINDEFTTKVVNSTTAWTTYTHTFTVPENLGVTYVGVSLSISGAVAGEVFYFDAFQLEYGSTANAYLDGDSADDATWDYQWQTANIKNLIANPSFETGTTGWAVTYATLSRSTTQKVYGTYAGTFTSNGTSTAAYMRTSTGTAGTPVKANTAYRFRANVWSPLTTAGRTISVVYQCYDSAGTAVGTGYTYTILKDFTSSAWNTVEKNFVTPANAAYVSVGVMMNQSVTIPSGTIHYLDGAMLTEGLQPYDYVDGSLGTGYAWTGTAHASASTGPSKAYSVALKTPTYAFEEPVLFTNIIGVTNEVNIDRAALDVGTFSATVYDPSLDPSVYAEVRPGKKVRVRSSDNGTDWTTFYEGTLTSANVSYEKRKDKTLPENKTVRISLNASDATTTLANTTEPRGLESIDSLPFILEDAGVPWRINGSGNQVTSATIVSMDDNASLLDQVFLTRDSKLGFAWVDRENILNVYDNAKMSKATRAVFRDWQPGVVTIPDSDFESSAWWPVQYPGNASYGATTEITTADKYAGASSMKVTQTGTAYVGLRTSPSAFSFPVEPDKGYTFSVAVKADATVTSLYTEVGFWDDANNYIAYTVDEFGYDIGLVLQGDFVPNQWVVYTATCIPPVGATHINFYMKIDGVAGSVAYIDSLQTTTDSKSYTDIDVTYNTDVCINDVTVKWLRYDSVAGTTEEIVYGPYVDIDSVTTYGPKSAEYTIHGATESSSAIATYAQTVLDKNAVPEIRPESLTFRAKTASDIAFVSSLDLYDLAAVYFEDKVRDTYRIVGISHNITPFAWDTEVRLEVTSTAAVPTKAV